MAGKLSSRTSPSPAGSDRDSEPLSAGLGRWLDRIALFVLLLVIASRPLISETYESLLRPIERAADAGASLTPAATAWFDLAIWASALAATLAANLRRRGWRGSGLEAGWPIMLAGVVLSVWAASNRRLALNASIDWLTALVLTMALVNLLRDRMRIVLTLGVIAATGLVSLAKCGVQKGVEFRETQEHYQSHKADFWARQGIPPDDPRVELFERRMSAREASGFLPYSNSQGALLSLTGFALLAMAGTRARTRPAHAVLLGLTGLLLGGTLLTGSRAAVAGTVLGLLLWWILTRLHLRLRPHWRLVWALAWLLMLAGAAAVVGYGLRTGGLPGSSLNFRWQYWQVTAQIIRDSLWTGVGALNFDRHYLLLKPVEYPEEIRDPHNFVLAVLSQWGLAGGIGLALAMLGTSYTAARCWGRHTPEDETAIREEHVALPTSKRWVLLLVGAFLILRFMIWYTPWVQDLSYWAMVWFDLGFYGLLWAGALIGLQWIGHLGRNAEVDGYRMPLLAGLIAFLLHNMIDFPMFVPATQTLMAALLGVLLARVPSRHGPDVSRVRRLIAPALAATGLTACVVTVWWPVTRCNASLSEARLRMGSQVEELLRHAARVDRWDPAPWVELAGFYSQTRDMDTLGKAVQALEQAILRDPEDSTLQQFKADLLMLRYEVGGAISDLWGAVGAARRAVAMYPNSPDRRLDLGMLLELLAAEVRDDEYLEEAMDQYRQSLALNAARPSGEPRRWPEARVRAVQARLEKLATRPAGDPEATMPATDP